jgi:hypothetical protein
MYSTPLTLVPEKYVLFRNEAGHYKAGMYTGSRSHLSAAA